MDSTRTETTASNIITSINDISAISINLQTLPSSNKMSSISQNTDNQEISTSSINLQTTTTSQMFKCSKSFKLLFSVVFLY